MWWNYLLIMPSLSTDTLLNKTIEVRIPVSVMVFFGFH